MEDYETSEELKSRILEVSRGYDHLIADLMRALELRDAIISKMSNKHEHVIRLLEEERGLYHELIRERAGLRPTPVENTPSPQGSEGLEASKKPGLYPRLAAPFMRLLERIRTAIRR